MSYKHITINERCCIVEYLNLGWSLSKIAKELNRNKSSISREIKRNNLNGRYKAHVAQDKYENRRFFYYYDYSIPFDTGSNGCNERDRNYSYNFLQFV